METQTVLRGLLGLKRPSCVPKRIMRKEKNQIHP